MSKITTPPPGRAPQRDWAAVAEDRKAHPNEWAVVAEDVSTGTAARLKARGLQVRVEGVKGSRAARMWARYVAPEEMKS